MSERKKIGLALGGGSSWGLAHIGVLKVLEENQIPIDMISGTSIGAVIGALYAAEPNAKKLEKETLEANWKKIFDYTFSKSGFIKGDAIEKFLEVTLSNLTFDQLKMPLFITATDLDKKQEVVFNKGNVSKAVHASISIPGIFVPQENNGRTLVDGGILDPIPISILRNAGADIIIAVNVIPIGERKPVYEEALSKKSKKKIPDIVHVTMRAFEIMQMDICRDEIELNTADLFISPKISEKIAWSDFSKIKEAIEIGERAARASIDDLQKITQAHPLKDFLKELGRDLGVSQIVQEVKKEVKEAALNVKDSGKK